MADAVGVATGSSEVAAVGDFDKPDKLEDRLVLLEYWKAVAAQRETEARQVLTDARAQHESDLAEISDELEKAKLGSLSLDLLAALLVGLSIGFTAAAGGGPRDEVARLLRRLQGGSADMGHQGNPGTLLGTCGSHGVSVSVD